MSHLSTWSSGLVLGLAAVIAVPLPPALAQPQPPAQPKDGPADPLELVRGLREHGTHERTHSRGGQGAEGSVLHGRQDG